jgi:hypothetical protein
MTHPSCKILLLTAIAAALPLTAHAQYQGQYYGQPAPAPLYPYAVQGDQPYAVEVAPNTYVIQRRAPARPYPYVGNQNSGLGIIDRTAVPAPGRFDRPHKPIDHSLVEELRQRHKPRDKDAVGKKINETVINTTRIVREKPVVIETERIVDDPPRVITRRHVVEDDAAPAAAVETEKPASRDDTKKRVIRAEAEVTILGPDRMSIRLFRKGQGSKANAQAD